MKNKNKKILAIVLVLVILVLGGASIYIATQLSSRQAVAPTAPESKPAASVGIIDPVIDRSLWVGSDECTVDAIAMAAPCVPNGTITCTPDCPTDCGYAASTISTCTDSCGVATTKSCPATTACPTATPTTAPTAVPTVIVTVAPTAVVTAAPTVIVTAAPTAVVTAAPTVAAPTALPEAGVFDLPGIAAFGGGLILAVVGILLAL